MDSKEHNRRELRTGIERLVRSSLSDEDYFVSDLSFWPQYGGGWKPSVGITGVNKEPPPLDATRQLALSVLLGEPVPTQVLLSAMEDAGMFPDGVFEEVADEREKIRFPVAEYLTEGDSLSACYSRRVRILYPARGRMMSEVADLCRSALGRGDPWLTQHVKRVVETWVAPREPRWTTDGRCFDITPSPDFMRRQVQNMPPLRRILTHIRLTATPRTAAVINRLLAHLDSVPARSNIG